MITKTEGIAPEDVENYGKNEPSQTEVFSPLKKTVLLGLYHGYLGEFFLVSVNSTTLSALPVNLRQVARTSQPKVTLPLS